MLQSTPPTHFSPKPPAVANAKSTVLGCTHEAPDDTFLHAPAGPWALMLYAGLLQKLSLQIPADTRHAKGAGFFPNSRPKQRHAPLTACYADVACWRGKKTNKDTATKGYKYCINKPVKISQSKARAADFQEKDAASANPPKQNMKAQKRKTKSCLPGRGCLLAGAAWAFALRGTRSWQHGWACRTVWAAASNASLSAVPRNLPRNPRLKIWGAVVACKGPRACSILSNAVLNSMKTFGLTYNKIITGCTVREGLLNGKIGWARAPGRSLTIEPKRAT